MADTNMNKNQSNQGNQTMQREEAKASVAGNRTPEQSKSDENRREQGEGREQAREKSAIGGGEDRNPSGHASQTGEPGRSRNELDQNRESGKGGEFDKSRSEPTGR